MLRSWMLSLAIASGCGVLPASEAQPEPGQRGGPREAAEGPVAVETAVARTGEVSGTSSYTGTTRPAQQVTLRSQVSGEIVELTADVGDAIASGDRLAQLDGDLQTAAFNEAQADLSARQAETVQAEVSIRNAETAVVQAQATLDQARIDAQRLRALANEGAIAQQEAEAAELAVTNAQQTLQSARAEVDALRQAAASAANQVDAQQAVVAQTQKQLSYAELRSPLSGVVLSRAVEVGDFVESGATILELGDLSTLEVTVQVSELDIGQLEVGQAARVRLDAFPGDGAILGEIERIAPVADPTSRLLPVTVRIPNVDRRMGSGLLARVQFSSGVAGSVIVPESALEAGTAENTIYVIEKTEETDEAATAIARSVRVGDRSQDRVEILAGLAPGESFVVKSDRPLTAGQAVRLSILSE
ncbi:MAG: efflux RND transporter periplasmic adaptor subunit [Cyanobacteria bacterium J06606_4]